MSVRSEWTAYDGPAYSSPAMRSTTSSSTMNTNTARMVSSPMADKVPELQADLEQAQAPLEMYQRALRDDEALIAEVRTLREFIDDVRLGIRDLAEYRAICG